MKKTILITGINGFLGSYLAKTLINEYQIVGLLGKSGNTDKINNLNLSLYNSSNTNLEELFIKYNIFAVIHTATVYKSDSSTNLINTNVILPTRLLELAQQHNTSLFLNTDSFINNPKYANYNYLTQYSLSKKNVLEWLFTIQGKCKLVNMKIFHMYGPNDSPNKFVVYTINNLESNISPIDFTKGEQKRDFIYVSDVVSAYQIVLEKHKKLDNFNEFEIGLGKSTSIKKFVLELQKQMQNKSKLNFGALPYRENEIMLSKAKNKNLKALGWTPNVSLNKGIMQTLNEK